VAVLQHFYKLRTVGSAGKPWPVLLLARELDLGGSERQLTEIAKNLDRSRFEPHVGFLRPGGLRAKELEAAGVPAIQFPVHSFKSLDALRATGSLARFIRRRNIRLVHTFDYPLTAFAAPVARWLTSAVVVSSQRAHRELIPRRYLRFVRGTDRFVDAIVVNCEFLHRHLERDEGVPPRKIHLCPNTIDIDEFQPGDHSISNAPASNSLVIGTVCALRPEKDLKTLLSAFERVRHLCCGLKLVVVGSGVMLERLKSQASALGIEEACQFVPATANVADWLRVIDIFVLPSRSEALSNSLMEAMACGCCPIASNVGGTPELVRNGETGFLFKPGDVVGLSALLTWLILDPSLRRRLAAAAQKFIRDNRSTAARMEEIYTQLIESHRRAAA
jgi:glycosyltransferase involved in cell wall biosynthesis